MHWPRQIETPRLVLRDPRPGDAQVMFDGYASDPEVVRYLGWRVHESPQDTQRLIQYDLHRWLKASAWVWVLALPDPVATQGTVIGQVELLPMSYPSDQAFQLRLGYMLTRACWGQGLMREALQALLPLALSQPAVWRLEALCDVENTPSARLLGALGMSLEGRCRRGVLHPNASHEPRDAWVFSMTREDLRVRQGPASASEGLDGPGSR